MKFTNAFISLLLLGSSAFANPFTDKDTDEDGQISISEYAGDDKKLKKKFKKLDKDEDGSLSEDEFAADSKKDKKGKKDKKKKDKK